MKKKIVCSLTKLIEKQTRDMRKFKQIIYWISYFIQLNFGH